MATSSPNAVKVSQLDAKSSVVSPISRISDAITGPTHYSDFGYGGLRTVATNIERDAITAARRVEGMLVYVSVPIPGASSTYYRLGSDLTTWTEFTSGGGGGNTSSVVISFATTAWTVDSGDTRFSLLVLTHDLDTLNTTISLKDSGGLIFQYSDYHNATNTNITLRVLNKNIFSGTAIIAN